MKVVDKSGMSVKSLIQTHSRNSSVVTERSAWCVKWKGVEGGAVMYKIECTDCEHTYFGETGSHSTALDRQTTEAIHIANGGRLMNSKHEYGRNKHW